MKLQAPDKPKSDSLSSTVSDGRLDQCVFLLEAEMALIFKSEEGIVPPRCFTKCWVDQSILWFQEFEEKFDSDNRFYSIL